MYQREGLLGKLGQVLDVGQHVMQFSCVCVRSDMEDEVAEALPVKRHGTRVLSHQCIHSNEEDTRQERPWWGQQCCAPSCTVTCQRHSEHLHV